MADGRTDPETTARTFLHQAVIRQDYSEAARCLDLRDIPSKLRASRGPDLARKLIFVMQRCGFAFPQEFPSEPDGWRFIWHSNHRGRIMLDRVRQPDGKDAWLFSRMTLRNLDALVDGFKDVPPDPRYARVGTVVDASVLTGARGTVPPPRSVPSELGSPRATLRTFLQASDDLEFDDTKAETALACLDLGEIPAGDRSAVGLRLAAKLQAILRPLNVDLLSVSDSWEAELLRFNPESDDSLTLSRQADGTWRFDRECVARIPEMFSRLSVDEKTARDRRTPFHSARQTMRTLLNAVGRGDHSLAAECLDLEAIPAGARSELGPGLAYKLAFVLDRLGRVVVQEIPNEPEGPAYFVYRGSKGRIELVRGIDATRPGDWLFAGDTVRQIDAMFCTALEQPLADRSVAASSRSLLLSPRMPAAVWIRARVPASLRVSILGLGTYQWVGLLIILTTSLALAWASIRMADTAVSQSLAAAKFDLTREFVVRNLSPMRYQVVLWVLYLQLPLLDLPIELVGRALPTVKFLWVGLLAWTIFRLTDLGTGVYSNSEHLKVRNNLSDMIVPTATRVFKVVVFLTALGYQVYLVGGGEWLTKLLAGLGLVGLAASLAAQDSLKNLFGTFLLIGEHPFKLGDLVVVNGLEGTVEGVGFRSTQVRTAEDSVLTIPNSVIAGSSIENRGMRKCRRYRTLVSMAYDTPVDRMIALRDALREIVARRPEVVRADKVDIHIFGLGNDRVELLLNVYFWVSTTREEMESRDWLNCEILLHADRLKVAIASQPKTESVTDPAPIAGISPGHPAIPTPKFAARKGIKHRAD